MTTASKVPVTVLTGFLGSGKTTLLNRILSENHGKRIAVIENEFGEVGVDNDLVIGAEEEIFEMNNGCICCTVRGDLIRILGNLMKRREKFDHIMIETTGMADPGPVAQTFFMDDEIQTQLSLDGVVTLIDAKHVLQHIDDSDEVQEQIAFADVILLNKVDLVSSAELDVLESRIHGMNSVAKIHRTRDAAVEMDKILNLGGFDLDRALETDPRFLEPEYPFEWSGLYDLAAGEYFFEMNPGPDPAMNVCLVSAMGHTEQAMRDTVEVAVRRYSAEETVLAAGAAIATDAELIQLPLEDSSKKFRVTIPYAGAWVLFTEHHPDEFKASLQNAAGAVVVPLVTREYKPDHEHDEEITSVGITSFKELDLKKFQKWLGRLLAEQGSNIFRMKGILNFKDMETRYVFQGVHMLFDGRPDRPWGNQTRRSSLIFIGRNLDRESLNAEFEACVV